LIYYFVGKRLFSSTDCYLAPFSFRLLVVGSTCSSDAACFLFRLGKACASFGILCTYTCIVKSAGRYGVGRFLEARPHLHRTVGSWNARPGCNTTEENCPTAAPMLMPVFEQVEGLALATPSPAISSLAYYLLPAYHDDLQLRRQHRSPILRHPTSIFTLDTLFQGQQLTAPSLHIHRAPTPLTPSPSSFSGFLSGVYQLR
jgi:hypothetical protein